MIHTFSLKSIISFYIVFNHFTEDDFASYEYVKHINLKMLILSQKI